jgi:DNA-binding transcriptional LysR family regulator
MPSLLSRFKKSHPTLEIDFRTNNATEIERLLLKHSIEIGLTTRPPKSPLIFVEPFRRERLELFVSRRHPLARVREVSLRDIERTPLLVRTTGGRDGTTIGHLKDTIEQHGIKVTIGMRFESPNAMMEAVQRNMGIGVVYDDNLDRDEFKVLRVRGLTLEGQSHILYLRDRSLSKPVFAFLKLLRSSRPENTTKLQFQAVEHFIPTLAKDTSLPFAAAISISKTSPPQPV